ncbi:MAG: glycosyltransferase family 39 protein [Solirubrobacterales bacterium]|nr:glycosyltransferase family 39 protein [Solirubrobacterales bacterium]
MGNLRGAAAARDIPAEVWITGAIVVVAAVIRIIVINTQSFWWDESLTAYEVRLPFGAMLNTVAHIETTPPLYFVAIWVWAHLFGNGEIALRSLSTLAGICLVPIGYLCARELVSRRAGVVAAALVALNPFMIWYSQEARAYMLLAALTGASFLWFIRTRRDPSVRNLIWWAVWSSLALMTHFFAVFAVVPEAAWLLWLVRTRLAAAIVAVVALIEVAMLPFAAADTTHGAGWIQAIHRSHRIATTIAEWGVSILYRQTADAGAFAAGAIFLAIVSSLLLLAGDRKTRAGAKVGASIAACVFLAPLALGLLGQDYFLSRNVIPAFIPLTVVVAAACVAPRARIQGLAFATTLLVMFSVSAIIVQTSPALERPNWRGVARAIGPAGAARAIVIVGGNEASPLKLYLPHVSWVQPPRRELQIQEVDLVGAPKWLPPIRRRAPDGTTLIGYRTTAGSAINRYAFPHPIVATVGGLAKLAPGWFRRRPAAVLVFFQLPGR